MSIGSLVFPAFIIFAAFILLGEAAMTWILRKVVWRGIQSTLVDKSDAEALLGRWHRGWRLWCLRLSSFLVIAALLWAVFPRPRSAGKWTAEQSVNRVIDRGVSAVKSRIPENGANSQKIKEGLNRAAEKAKSSAAPG